MLSTLARGLSTDKLLTHIRLPLYRNAYALLISTAVTSALGLLYWILAARYYPADVVGINAAVISMLTFLAGLAQLPFMNAVLRYGPVAGADTKRFVAWAYAISLSLALLTTVGFLATVEWWSPALGFLRDDGWLVTWFLVGVVAWCLFALQDNVLTGLRQAIYVPIENIPYAIVKIVLLIWLAGAFAAYGILASWTFPLLFVLLPVNYLIFRRLIPQHVAAAPGERLGFSLRQISYYIAGNSVGALFLLAASRLLPVLVTNLAGAAATAYFYLPWTIATSLRLVVANMTTSFTVEVAKDNSKLRGYSYRFLVHTTTILALPIGVIMLAAPWILAWSGEDYAAEGTLLLRLITLSALPHILTSLQLAIARVHQRVGGIILLQASLCLLTFVLSYPLLNRFGITGVGIAILIAEVIVAIVVFATSLWPILGAPLLGKMRGADSRRS